MSTLNVRLFGKFSASRDGLELKTLQISKVQELFSYLLLHWNRPIHREALSALLWGDSHTAQAKKYLRDALWKLQQALDSRPHRIDAPELLVDADWIRINPEADLNLDVARFEQAHELAREIRGRALDPERAHKLQMAVELYQGDLLEGWYQDWCLYERERLQNMFLGMLDKLMGYCEAQHQYEAGLAYGEHILRYDHARERTYQRLMRLYYLMGDRAAALRQYERCTTALHQDLGVKPAQQTARLYEQIRADSLSDMGSLPSPNAPLRERLNPPPSDLRTHLKQLRTAVLDTQQRLMQEIDALEASLNRPH